MINNRFKPNETGIQAPASLGVLLENKTISGCVHSSRREGTGFDHLLEAIAEIITVTVITAEASHMAYVATVNQ